METSVEDVESHPRQMTDPENDKFVPNDSMRNSDQAVLVGNRLSSITEAANENSLHYTTYSGSALRKVSNLIIDV